MDPHLAATGRREGAVIGAGGGRCRAGIGPGRRCRGARSDNQSTVGPTSCAQDLVSRPTNPDPAPKNGSAQPRSRNAPRRVIVCRGRDEGPERNARRPHLQANCGPQLPPRARATPTASRRDAGSRTSSPSPKLRRTHCSDLPVQVSKAIPELELPSSDLDSLNPQGTSPLPPPPSPTFRSHPSSPLDLFFITSPRTPTNPLS